MSKSLKTLLRLSRWSVDEKQKALRAVLDRQDQIKQALLDHHRTLENERNVATNDFTGVGCLFGSYFKAWEAYRDHLNGLLREIGVQVDLARDELAEAYRAQKSTEEVQKQRELAEALEISRKETAELDEIGLNQFLKRRETDA